MKDVTLSDPKDRDLSLDEWPAEPDQDEAEQLFAELVAGHGEHAQTDAERDRLPDDAHGAPADGAAAPRSPSAGSR